MQLLGDNEERDVATQIRKNFKAGHSSRRAATESYSDILGQSPRALRPAPYFGGSFGSRGPRTRPYGAPPDVLFNAEGLAILLESARC